MALLFLAPNGGPIPARSANDVEIEQTARPAQSSWPEWLPHSWSNLPPWMRLSVTVLGALGVGKALQAAIGDWLLGEGSASLLANLPAIFAYRRALDSRYRYAHLPFRPGRPVDVSGIYIPLTAVTGFADTEDSRPLDAETALARYRRVLVLAPPGGGKSMLLRHIALQYSAVGMRRLKELRAPILFELHRLNTDSRSLTDQLADRLRGADLRFPFWNPARFIAKGFRSGRLLILLDGVDEVDSSQRQRANAQIRDLLQTRCNVVVTCRSAVYNGELNDELDGLVRIQEFNDEQMVEFADRWQQTEVKSRDREAGTAEALLRVLADRPQLGALARNPLLLTIIAFLHFDLRRTLPHSRAEFYRQATGELLQGWKRERNLFGEPDKRKALRAIAIQGTDRNSGEPRLTITRDLTIQSVRELAIPDVKPADLIREIVERSGLLTEEDHGEQYRWTHLTFREYFIAEAFAGREGEILSVILDAPETWREIVKLWCGLATDASAAVRTVLPLDPVMALECASEAAFIDDALYVELAELIQKNIRVGLPGFERAAGTLSARAAGEPVLNRLLQLAGDPDRKTRLASADALSCANSQAAASVVAKISLEDDAFLPYLRLMGGQAITALAEFAEHGSARAVFIMAEVGGRAAVRRLVDLLARNDAIAVAAAWSLAGIMADPAVEAMLQQTSLPRDRRDSPDWLWVGVPFAERAEEPVARIVARIAALICSHEPLESLPNRRIDPRLAIPLCAVHYGAYLREVGKAIDEKIEPATDEDTLTLGITGSVLSSNESWRQSVDNALESRAAPASVRAIMQRIPASLEYEMIRRTCQYRVATQRDWKQVHSEGVAGLRLPRHLLMGLLSPFIVVGALQVGWMGLILLTALLLRYSPPPWALFLLLCFGAGWFGVRIGWLGASFEQARRFGCLVFLVAFSVWCFVLTFISSAFGYEWANLKPGEVLHELAWFAPTRWGFWLIMLGAAACWLWRRSGSWKAKINPLYGLLDSLSKRNRVLRWRLAAPPPRSPFVTLSIRKSA